ncbi:histidine kinase [[Leptolyngbya] sp. PCC 7376]|uniref:ATP-binding protein n=1 Tax=[Leptolyngbya] sp. PCC 7376 TaxID=111781 RepID=UPI00029F1826|nr:ATP-binding protein [[Leptolyngbya] sp. PCC 7376]AFY38784.1 histidine kinase [[Leptolyngbya] sp. PCC 7376]
MLLTLPMVSDPKRNLSSTYADSLAKLTIESSLRDLTLYKKSVDVKNLTKILLKIFENDTVIPGVILKKGKEFYGMVSRRRFLKRMSRPYALDLFLKRPLTTLYNVDNFPVNILPESTPVLEAAQFALEREGEQMYEPIVVQRENGKYALIDVPLVLYAQSHIHKLTNELLQEKTHAHVVQTEKMASLGRMVAGVAHEIRNPVNCVHGNVSFLQNYFDDLLGLVKMYQAELPQPSVMIANYLKDIEIEFLEEDLPKILQSVEISAVRMIEIVTSLRNFSRIDETKQQLIKLPECLDSTLLILNNRTKKHRVKITRNYEANLPDILGYSGQLSQVFINLLANALDALEEKLSRQDFLAETAWIPEIQVDIFTQFSELDSDGLNESRDWICVKISDNADGMPKKVRQRIFEEFFTTKPRGKGTGLGLAISHEIVTRKHAGRLELTTKIGEGSAFSIWLPLQSFPVIEQLSNKD